MFLRYAVCILLWRKCRVRSIIVVRRFTSALNDLYLQKLGRCLSTANLAILVETTIRTVLVSKATHYVLVILHSAVLPKRGSRRLILAQVVDLNSCMEWLLSWGRVSPCLVLGTSAFCTYAQVAPVYISVSMLLYFKHASRRSAYYSGLLQTVYVRVLINRSENLLFLLSKLADHLNTFSWRVRSASRRYLGLISTAD